MSWYLSLAISDPGFLFVSKNTKEYLINRAKKNLVSFFKSDNYKTRFFKIFGTPKNMNIRKRKAGAGGGKAILPSGSTTKCALTSLVDWKGILGHIKLLTVCFYLNIFLRLTTLITFFIVKIKQLRKSLVKSNLYYLNVLTPIQNIL